MYWVGMMGDGVSASGGGNREGDNSGGGDGGNDNHEVAWFMGNLTHCFGYV